jgi:phosphohistidine phosphatase
MKTLLLMRHAKATWDHDQWPDFERPLNPTGEADAPRMGRRMIQADLKPDAILCSSARRTMQTAELVAEELGITPLIQSKADLYLCPVSVWEDLIQRLSPELNCVLCVGHNNGLEDLVSHLLRKRKSFSTAGLARVELNDWAGFDRSIQPSHIEVWEPE